MKLYKIEGQKLTSVSATDFKLEKDIQAIVEKNLPELFTLQFVQTELTIKNFRIDTLGYNKENKSFVIIEYKKERNFSVIDQGYTYLSLMLNNKADFILEYNEYCNGHLRKDDIDWSQSRVIFISPQFTEYQKHSVNFKDVPFELWEIKRYENNSLGLIEHKNTSSESIANISKDKNNIVNQVSKEVKVYTEEYHFNKSKNPNQKIIQLYKQLRERILNLGEVEIVPKGTYISFKKEQSFTDIVIFQKGLYIIINLQKGNLNDPEKLAKDVSNTNHWGNGDYSLVIDTNADLDYVMFLINQSYKKQAGI